MKSSSANRADARPFQTLVILENDMAEILRQKTPAERLLIADRMWCFARDMIRNIVIREHPEWSNAEVRQAVARRLSHGAV